MSLTNIKVGDKIRCKRGVDGQPPEILDVLKIYDDRRVLLCHENGNRAFVPLNIQTLRDYDYELVTKNR